MKGLTETVAAVNIRMSVLETKREASLTMSRAIIRKTKRMIHAIHVGEDYMVIQGELKMDMKNMISKLKTEPEIFYSAPVEDAMMEYAEAFILSATVRKKDVPSFESMKITPRAWMMGLADCVGELRRLTLSSLMNDDLAKAEYYFSAMEEMSTIVLSFDVPDAIVPIRKKQDVTRGIVEKTRADMVSAKMFSKIKTVK